MVENPSFFNSQIFTYAVIPLLIFIARILDVSIGTIRIISISRGVRVLAALLGFFEVLIWLVAITQIMRNLTNVVNYIAYAAGFGMGNFVGISIENKLAIGSLIIRVVTKKDATDLVGFLGSQRYGVTTVDAHSATGPVKVIYIVTRRTEAPKVISTIKKFNPQAFYIVEDVRFVAERRKPHLPRYYKALHFNRLFQKRK
ncbi:MAG: DUF2179 domain-containing protein [Candidatus Omnitrophota bacterium]|nr:MAG: DUF2179 domain-containing protein [Candidatus Omnitrophota bacterium]